MSTANPVKAPQRRFEVDPALRTACLVAAVVLGGLYLTVQRDFGPGAFYLPWKGYIIWLLGLLPGVAYLHKRERRLNSVEPIPLVPIIMAIYALYFGLPVMLSDQVIGMGIQPPTPALEYAVELSILGMVGLLFSFYVLSPKLALGRPLDLSWDPDRARYLAILGIPFGLALRFALRFELVPGPLMQPAVLLSMLFQVSVGILIVLSRQGLLDKRATQLVWGGLVPLFFLVEISEGAIGSAARLIAFFVMLILGTGGRINMPLVAVGAAVILVLRGGAMEFRDLANNSPHLLSEDPFERALQFFEISFHALTDDGGDKSQEILSDRIAQVAVLGHVVDKSPIAVDYWDGTTYLTLPGSFIPRVIWPDKPVKDLGQRFGHRYAILDSEDYTTSINFPQLVELYANFGGFGVGLGMVIFGLFFRWISNLLNSGRGGDGAVVVGAAVFSPLLNIESDASLVLGAALQTAIVLYAVMRFCRPKSFRRRRLATHRRPSLVATHPNLSGLPATAPRRV